MVSLEEAQNRLAEIIDPLPPGEEVVITRDDKPVARLVRLANQGRPRPGMGKGMLTIVSDDDEHLKDFVECMPAEGD